MTQRRHVPAQHPSRIRPGTRAAHRVVRAVAAAALFAASWAAAPSSASASRLGSDRVGGVAMSSGVVSTASAPDVSARAGALVASDGRVLWTRRSRSERPMASTTKIMTALVVLERCRLDETVRITKTADRTPYGTGLRTGERRSVRKLLELTLVASSNDAATALAIHAGGSVSGFAKLMNARAAGLGLTDTRFRNPHGLDATGHYASALDLDKIMTAALTHTEFRRIIKMRRVYLPRYRSRPARFIKSTDKLLGTVDGLLGGKTGFTNDARYCFVGSVRRDGLTLNSVVLGAPSSVDRFTSSRRLLEWGMKNYRYRTLCSAEQTAGAVPVSSDPSLTVPVVYANTVRVRVLRVLGPVRSEHSLPASVTAPVEVGQKLGEVRFVQQGQVLATVDAVAAAPLQ